MFHSHTNGFLAEASGYAMDETGLRIMCGRHGMKTGDSGVVSTIDDMEKWCDAILYGRLLKKESWNECLTLYLERFGFGFRGYGNWIGHNGGMPGIATYERFHMESKTALVLMCNVTGCSRIQDGKYADNIVVELIEYLDLR
jgi:CubicO group peptidase (beta-lactamase class C family)